MHKFLMMAATLLCFVGSLKSAHGAEQQLGLRGQLYFETGSVSKPLQHGVPRHISAKYIAQAPVDFSYPETAASPGSQLVQSAAPEPRGESPWDLELTDGAKLRFAYDKDTKLKLGLGMWKVKVGVSQEFGGPNAGTWELPVRHGRAAALGRAAQTEATHPLN